MKVRVLFFASVRDLTGMDMLDVELTESATISELRSFLTTKFPAIGSMETKIAVALNEEYVLGDAKLKNGDEIALIPPVSGGK